MDTAIWDRVLLPGNYSRHLTDWCKVYSLRLLHNTDCRNNQLDISTSSVFKLSDSFWSWDFKQEQISFMTSKLAIAYQSMIS